MIRSCYTTIARFYDGDPTTDPIAWQFVPENFPFLPVPSCINSLNWVERRGLTDNGRAGEVAGASRPYSKGGRDISLIAQQYCGDDTDWQGLGTRPTTPVPLNAFGQPACCWDQTFAIKCTVKLYNYVAFQNLIFPAVVDYTLVSDQCAFNAVYGFWNGAPAYYPYNVDLYYDTDPLGDPSVIETYLICEFPGYATQVIYPGPANPWTLIGNGEFIENVLSWYQDGPAIFTPKMVVKGVVVWDPSRTVVAVSPMAYYTSFGYAGAQLGIALDAYALRDY